MSINIDKSIKTANLQYVKQKNLTLVFNLINVHQPVSRASIAHATGLSPTTVSSLVDELLSENMIAETGMGKLAGSGRKPIMLEVNPKGGCVAAVELTHDGFCLEVFDISGKSVKQAELKTADYEKIGYEIADEIERLDGDCGRLLGICVGVPGVIDRKTKRVTSTIIPIDPDNNFFDVLCERFPDLKIKLGNESSFCAYIEKTEHKRKIHSLVYIDINVGIGAGIILEDRIFTGAFGNAGEFGHVSVDINGRPCKCGNRGCLEVMAGVPAICETAGVKNIAEIDMNDGKTAEKLAPVCKYIACGINNVINLINPEAVVIGGEITKLGEPFLEKLRGELKVILSITDRERFSLSFSTVSGNPVTRGAGRYMLDRIFENGDFIIE